MVSARAGSLHLCPLRAHVWVVKMDSRPRLEPLFRLDAGARRRNAGPAGVLPGPEMANRGRP